MSDFTAQMDDIVAKSKERMTAVARQATQMVIDDAQLQTTKGGRMRVDTGFLRLSGTASLDGLPSGPGRGESKERGFYVGQNSDTVVAQVMGNFDIGTTFYFGWTANYAKYRETFDGFLEAALQNWPEYVSVSTNRLKEQIK